jgi:hypothetical protein
MQYSVGNERRSTFVWSFFFVLLVYQIISNPQFFNTKLHNGFRLQTEVSYRQTLTIYTHYLVKKKSYYKQIYNNMHTFYHTKLKLQHQTNAPLSPTCLPPLKHRLFTSFCKDIIQPCYSKYKIIRLPVTTDNNFWTREYVHPNAPPARNIISQPYFAMKRTR